MEILEVPVMVRRARKSHHGRVQRSSAHTEVGKMQMVSMEHEEISGLSVKRTEQRKHEEQKM